MCQFVAVVMNNQNMRKMLIEDYEPDVYVISNDITFTVTVT